MEIELKSRDQNLSLEFGQINHLNETGKIKKNSTLSIRIMI